MSAMTFRAIWPIVDDTVPTDELHAEALAEVPALVIQARARLADDGHFFVAPSAMVPGCGHETDTVLVYEAPAVRETKATVDERLEDLRFMDESAESLGGAARRLGLTRNGLDVWLRRYDQALRDRLAARDRMPEESRKHYPGKAAA